MEHNQFSLSPQMVELLAIYKEFGEVVARLYDYIATGFDASPEETDKLAEIGWEPYRFSVSDINELLLDEIKRRVEYAMHTTPQSEEVAL